MNKELIKKYKKEFDYWLNGGEVLFFYWEDWYSSTCNPEMVFNHISPDDVKYYIINDEFVEIRKALAEGKTIQYNFGNYGINKKDFPNKWKDLDQSIGILADRACPENYRIKPEEPKFEVGDWVVNRINEIGQILQEDYKGKGLYKISNTHALKCEVGTSAKDLTIWVPKSGEWCWFWDYDNQPAIGKSNGVTPSSENCDFYMGNTSHPYNIPHLFQGFVFCEPYIGQLPSVIKDNK